jgi:hypothetical protein
MTQGGGICGEHVQGASDGGTPENPVPLPLPSTFSLDNWTGLLTAIQTKGKFVALDLSACTTGVEFDPGTANTGKSFIVSLVLPYAAESIKAGASYSNPTFKHFTSLKQAGGEGITTIGNYAFRQCSALTEASFPAAIDIGAYAFGETGTTALTLTLGNVAPTLGDGMFYVYDVSEGKTVTVKVPSGATGYVTGTVTLPVTYSGSENDVCWGNGFRGRGWDGSAFTSTDTGDLNSNITLTIMYKE